MDVQSGKASAVTQTLHHTVELKLELLRKAKSSVFKSMFVPILSHGHEFWVTTEKMQSQMHEYKMRFLQKFVKVTIFGKLRNTAIQKSLNIESLLLRMKRSQLRWFGHVSRMPQERLPKKTLHADVKVERGRLDNHKQGGLLVGTVWDFIQAKCSLRWWIEGCASLMWSCGPGNLKQKRLKNRILCRQNLHSIFL